MAPENHGGMVQKALADIPQINNDLETLINFINDHPDINQQQPSAIPSANDMMDQIDTAMPDADPDMNIALSAMKRGLQDMQKTPALDDDTMRSDIIKDINVVVNELISGVQAMKKHLAAVAANLPEAPEPAAAVAPPKVDSKALSGNQLKALVLVEGDEGVGTGFIVKLHDQFFVMTNQHVLSGNKKFTVTGMDGTHYPTNGALFGAVGYDVAMLKIPAELAVYYLEVMDDPQTNAQADEAVTVPGNSLGAKVPLQINGKLLGVGPELVEVNAKFVSGNSGSPIIYRPTGKVIGIATYTLTYQLEDTKKTDNVTTTRWFGYRIDNIKRWEALDWARFSAEGIKVRAVEDMSDLLIALLEGQKLPDVNVDKTLIDGAISTYQSDKALAQRHNSPTEYVEAIQRLNNNLHSIGDNNLKQLTGIPLYSYHANKLKEQLELRKEIDKAFLDINRLASSVNANL